MTEDGSTGGFSDGPTVSNDALQTRQRKKRKLDQHVEAFVSVGFIVPFNNLGDDRFEDENAAGGGGGREGGGGGTDVRRCWWCGGTGAAKVKRTTGKCY
ncbi:hypothetical protein V6N12_042324 [Hibiscus sabdariffa]|uniref:Uncharacterized protein n=1 Tax=Hibiscus sabdariffa TaxID=183260 RepID=A0ABR2EEF4_9ROSI